MEYYRAATEGFCDVMLNLMNIGLCLLVAMKGSGNRIAENSRHALGLL
jgi:hypothetical protein